MLVLRWMFSVLDSHFMLLLQLYMESIQDLLAPEKTSIPINEDARTGEVSLPDVSVVKVQYLDHFSELLQIGEANRHAANTKQNTESSRSHAILMVSILLDTRFPCSCNFKFAEDSWCFLTSGDNLNF